MQRVALMVWVLSVFAAFPLAGRAQEPPTISRIDIIGNKEISPDRILEVIQSKPGDPVIRERLRRDLQAIFDMGFFTDVKIEMVPEEKRDPSERVRVIFQVVENPIVRKIEIVGAKLAPPDGLKNLMRTKPGEILNTKTLHGDVVAVNDHYEEMGYTEPPNHVTDMQWTADGTITLTITEGIPITKIVLVGNTVYSTDRLLGLVKTPKGDLFNKKKIEEDIGRIGALYTADDYLIQGLKATIAPDGTLAITVQEAQVEAIIIKGNTKTRERVIRHLIRTRVGEILKSSKLKKDHQRLNNTGYFEKADVAPEEGSGPGKVKLVFTVKEQKTGFATAGIGFAGGGASRGGGLTGTISFTERNIAGTGRSGSIGWQKGALVSALNFTFLYPFFDEADSSIGVSYFNSTLEEQRQALPNTDPVRFALFKDRRVGGRITLGREILEDYRMFLSLKAEKLRATPTPTADFPELIPNPTNGNLNSVSLLNVYDTRDDVFNARSGQYYSASVESAGRGLGGDFNFLKYIGEARRYFPLDRKSAFAVRLMAGGSGGDLPLAEKFVLGGSDTLRGYTLNRFIGDKFVLFSAEYRFPVLGSKIFSGAAFFDAGNAWQKGETMRLRDLKDDYGVGIRIVIPGLGLGTVRVDFAIGQEGKRTVFGIGQSF